MRIATHSQEETMYSGQRSYYLALALDARRTLNALGAGEDLTPALDAIRTTVETLKALRTPQDLYRNLYAKGGYEHPEQLRALQDVQNLLQDKELTAKLERLVDKSNKLDSDALAFAKKFFLALESRALHYYDDPSLAERSA